MNISLHEVHRVQVTPTQHLGTTERMTREIVIYMKDGTSVTIELFTTNVDIRLEIE